MGTGKVPVVRVDQLGDYVGEEVVIQGWLYNKRSSGKIRFLEVRDGTGIVQAVLIKNAVAPEVFSAYDSLTQESSVIVQGQVRADPRAPGGYELGVSGIRIVQVAEDYPITPKEHGIEFLMDHRHLWLRSRRQHAILRIRSEVVKAARDWLDDHGFILIDAPILTPTAVEGTTTLFETQYFDEKAYLTQSGQLYMEAAAMAHGRVYCFGPTFRAEKSKTRRHLTEFWMLEPEMAYADLEEDMRVQEELVSYIVQRVLEKRRRELEVLEREISRLEKISPPFPRLSYDDAVELVNGVIRARQAAGEEAAEGAPGREEREPVAELLEWGDDLGAPHETIISNQYDKPVFVHRYPVQAKAFYMKPDPERPEVVLCADLLAPEGYGEIIGGGQRIDDYDLLRQRLMEHGLPTEAYEWYLDLRRYGSVPHAGFGLGIERTVAWICGLPHVREAVPFPRLLNRLRP
ncbi:MAG TPA: asparagine--tRNA ligase [Firmicutes bacterium]|nr:asparagine--tRNA ligase [Bacillota bacterium]